MADKEQSAYPLCRRCLTRDLVGEEEYFRSLHDYINNLDDDIKAEADLYEERLTVCRQCERLFQGMCAICGCYVELRAAIGHNKCPGGKW